MFRKLVRCYCFIFTFSELFTLTHLTFHDSSHGFISKSPRYFDDELSHIREEIGSLRYLKSQHSADVKLRFEPEVLDFRERPLGVPHSETVTLFNTDNNKTIDLSSISGNTVHFHSSFFEDKKIPPNGNTSFKIVYLGRQEGPVESTLFLHTSSGFIKYNVRAFGTFSSYRVRPIVGVKLPVNSTFTPVIYMHNPHSEPIQIVEIYSSGGGFHLELPSGQHEGPNDLWEIHPQETKAIIRVRFEAKVAQNHTAYIRIKLHNPEEILIVPLEVEVTPVQSIFHPHGHVDFGVGGSMDPPKEINLCLFNPLRRAVRVHSVSTLSKAIKTQYYNIRINPGNEEENKCVNVGTLTVDWKTAWKNKDYCGKIIVKFRNGKNRTEIPYFLTVLKGGLTYDKMSTTYFLNDKDIDTTERKFEVKNEFQIPVNVLDVQFPFDADTAFKIQTFTPKTIRPFEKETLFNIRLKSTTKKTDMQLSSYIKLITNVSEISVPLLSYNGKVQIHLPFASEDFSLDVGLIGLNSRKQVYFMLNNPNPVDLPFIHVYSSIPMTEIELFGCGTGDHKMVLVLNHFENLSKCDRIVANGYAVIQLTIVTNSIEGEMWGDLQIQTPYENLSLPVHFKVSPGKLLLDNCELIFENCFPGKMCTHPLKVYSSFSEKMTVENIVALPPDKRISAAITASILPKVNRVIGHMYFNPDLDCSPDCYTGLVHEGSASWLRQMAITKQVTEYDLNLVNTFYNRFLNFTKQGLVTWKNLTLRLDTSEVKGHLFTSKVQYIWPSIIKEKTLINNTLEFPLVQVGNITHKNLFIYNPSSSNLVVQLIFENDYPHADMLYDGLSQDFIPSSDTKLISNKGFSFDEKIVEHQREYFWDSLRVNVYKHSLPFILLPNQSRKVSLGFLAEEAKSYSNLLFLRNNLTIMEVVRVNGKGTTPLFKFGNRKPGATQPLYFEISDKYLTECHEEDVFPYQTPILPSLTIKRSFSARNLGEIPIQVHKFRINDFPCEGYGFKVLNCSPFILYPNITKKIDIAFTPDLTMTKVTRTLVLETSLNMFVNYSLFATIPQAVCESCEKLLTRPSWEIYMSYITIVFMKVMFFLILFIAVLDAETIKRHAWDVFVSSSSPPVMPVLDLRKIGKQVKEEIQSISKELKKSDQDLKKDINNDPEGPQAKSEPAIIPTTGKAKKKQAMNEEEPAFDNDLSLDKLDKERNRERQRKKDILFERHRLKSMERRTEKEMKLLEEKGRKEKHLQQREVETKKGQNVAIHKKISRSNSSSSNSISAPTLQEEEASSTTTESSNSSTNCDEVDKENQRLNNWPKSNLKNISPFETMGKSSEATNLTNETKPKHVSFIGNKMVKTNNISNNVRTGNKSHVKVNKEQEAMLRIEDKMVFTNHNRQPRDKRRDRDSKYKDRKDKMIFRKKNDRKNKLDTGALERNEEIAKNQADFYIPFPKPTTECPGWCESKPKFSDIVTRNEIPNCSTPVPDSSQTDSSSRSSSLRDDFDKNSPYLENKNIPIKRCPLEEQSRSYQQQQLKGASCGTKPTMYVEPYKPIDLGPIGSKRLGTPGKDSPDFFDSEPHDLLTDVVPPPVNMTAVNVNQRSGNAAINFSPIHDKSVIAAISNNVVLSNVSNESSFFTQSQAVPLGNNIVEGGMFNRNPHIDANWGRQQNLGDSFGNQMQNRVEMDNASLLSGQPEEELWHKQTPLTSSAAAGTTDYWSNTFSTVLDSTSQVVNNASYLWGSNPVWKPWTPADAPGTPRRTPPGFDEKILEKKAQEEQRRLQQRDTSYSPFGSGCTWAQQKNPWE